MAGFSDPYTTSESGEGGEAAVPPTVGAIFPGADSANSAAHTHALEYILGGGGGRGLRGGSSTAGGASSTAGAKLTRGMEETLLLVTRSHVHVIQADPEADRDLPDLVDALTRSHTAAAPLSLLPHPMPSRAEKTRKTTRLGATGPAAAVAVAGGRAAVKGDADSKSDSDSEDGSVDMDAEALELYKIVSFIDGVAAFPRISIPVGMAGDNVAAVERWPLVQAYALQEVGPGGFLTRTHEVVNVCADLVHRAFRSVDAHTCRVLAWQARPAFAAQWHAFMSGLNECSPVARYAHIEEALIRGSDSAVFEPLNSLHEFSALAAANELSASGLRCEDDTQREASLRVVPVDPSTVALLIRANDNNSGLRASRTYFMHCQDHFTGPPDAETCLSAAVHARPASYQRVVNMHAAILDGITNSKEVQALLSTARADDLQEHLVRTVHAMLSPAGALLGNDGANNVHVSLDVMNTAGEVLARAKCTGPDRVETQTWLPESPGGRRAAFPLAPRYTIFLEVCLVDATGSTVAQMGDTFIAASSSSENTVSFKLTDALACPYYCAWWFTRHSASSAAPGIATSSSAHDAASASASAASMPALPPASGEQLWLPQRPARFRDVQAAIIRADGVQFLDAPCVTLGDDGLAVESPELPAPCALSISNGGAPLDFSLLTGAARSKPSRPADLFNATEAACDERDPAGPATLEEDLDVLVVTVGGQQLCMWLESDSAFRSGVLERLSGWRELLRSAGRTAPSRSPDYEAALTRAPSMSLAAAHNRFVHSVATVCTALINRDLCATPPAPLAPGSSTRTPVVVLSSSACGVAGAVAVSMVEAWSHKKGTVLTVVDVSTDSWDAPGLARAVRDKVSSGAVGLKSAGLAAQHRVLLIPPPFISAGECAALLAQASLDAYEVCAGIACLDTATLAIADAASRSALDRMCAPGWCQAIVHIQMHPRVGDEHAEARLQELAASSAGARVSTVTAHAEPSPTASHARSLDAGLFRVTLPYATVNELLVSAPEVFMSAGAVLLRGLARLSAGDDDFISPVYGALRTGEIHVTDADVPLATAFERHRDIGGLQVPVPHIVDASALVTHLQHLARSGATRAELAFQLSLRQFDSASRARHAMKLCGPTVADAEHNVVRPAAVHAVRGVCVVTTCSAAKLAGCMCEVPPERLGALVLLGFSISATAAVTRVLGAASAIVASAFPALGVTATTSHSPQHVSTALVAAIAASQPACPARLTLLRAPAAVSVAVKTALIDAHGRSCLPAGVQFDGARYISAEGSILVEHPAAPRLLSAYCRVHDAVAALYNEAVAIMEAGQREGADALAAPHVVEWPSPAILDAFVAAVVADAVLDGESDVGGVVESKMDDGIVTTPVTGHGRVDAAAPAIFRLQRPPHYSGPWWQLAEVADRWASQSVAALTSRLA